MVGMVLGLGFQWWPALKDPWQYLAFIFVYLDIVDFWIDYSPSLKKFPPKREIDVMLDIAIMFSLFLYIYATQITLVYFLTASILLRILDFFWLLSSKYEYRPTNSDKVYIDTWLFFDLLEAALAGVFIGITFFASFHPFFILFTFIIFSITVRILASMQYKKVHFV